MASPAVRFMSSRSWTSQPASARSASIFSRALASGACLLPVGDIAQCFSPWRDILTRCADRAFSEGATAEHKAAGTTETTNPIERRTVEPANLRTTEVVVNKPDTGFRSSSLLDHDGWRIKGPFEQRRVRLTRTLGG